MDGFKKALQLGVRDASADVRKAARHLFWVLKSIPMYEHKMDQLLNQFDNSTRKHIEQELQTASEDFIELLNNPTGGLDDASIEYTHVTPFDSKRTNPSVLSGTYMEAHTSSPSPSFSQRPLSDQSRREEGKITSKPPSLPAQTQAHLPPPPHEQSQPPARQPSGPSRVLHTSQSVVGRRSNPSSDPPIPSLNGHSSAFSASVKSSADIEDHQTGSNDRSNMGSMTGGSRRTSMAPERVIRQKPNGGMVNAKSMRQSEEYANPAPLDLPLPGPPALSISNSIRNKRQVCLICYLCLCILEHLYD